MPIAEIEPKALKELLDNRVSVLLIDVRQAEEHELVRLVPSILIPLDELQERWEEISRLAAGDFKEFVVYCRSGARSGHAIQWLEQQGLTGFKNLRGGINSYAREADPSLQPY